MLAFRTCVSTTNYIFDTFFVESILFSDIKFHIYGALSLSLSHRHVRTHAHNTPSGKCISEINL